MSYSDQTDMHGSLVHSIDMTLPVEFVRTWLASTAKQYWTAEVENTPVADNSAAKSGKTGSDVSVATDVMCGQKTYLYARFTCVQLCVKDGRLQLNVVDMSRTSGQCDAGKVSQNGETNSQQCVAQHLPPKNEITSHTPQLVVHSSTPSSNCSNKILCEKTLTESLAEVDVESGLKTNCIEIERIARTLTTSAVNDGESRIKLKDGKPDSDSPESASKVACHQATPVDQVPTPPAPVDQVPTPPAPVDQVPTPPAPVDQVPTPPAPVDQVPTPPAPSPVRTSPAADSDKPQGSATKRKRGRPKKSIKTLPTAVNSTGTAPWSCPVSNPQNVEPTLPTTSRYNLRGMKLPVAIFGDSGSELEEEEDEEYHPPSKKSVPLKSSSAALEAKPDRPLEEDKPYTESNSERKGCCEKEPEGNEDRNIDSTGGTAERNREQHQRQESLKQNQIKAATRDRKRWSSPECAGYEPSSVDAEQQPLKKKRMKIDVTGLPSYARRKRNSERNATCKYCQRKFCDFTGVLVHVRKFHDKKEDLEEYQEELKRQAVVKCSICSKEFDNRFQLYLHEDKVHFQAGELPCGHCGKTFPNMVLVKQHIRSVHQVKGQQHVCVVCNARFKWATTLKVHMAEVHQGIRNLECGVCGKKFYRQAQLNRHAIIHGPDDAKLSCQVCGRRFSYLSNLQRHMSIVHGPQDETWHCAYCEKGFQRKESMHNHVEKVHFSIFPYHCAVCKAGFLRAVLLEKHMSSEHNVENFEVPSARRAHFKYNRSEDEDLRCGICDEKFFYKTQLVQHIFTVHSDTFPFHCDVCQQVFMEKSFLVLHCKRAHAIHPSPEDVELNVEDSFVVQDNMAIAGILNSGSLQQNKKTLLPSSKRKGRIRVEESQNENDSYPASSFVIKVENGNNTVQYVIHNPEGDGSAPSEAVVQDIANYLLAASQATQDGGIMQNIVLQPVSDPSQQPSEAPQVIFSHTVGNVEDKRDVSSQVATLEGGHCSQAFSIPHSVNHFQQDVDTQQAIDTPHAMPVTVNVEDGCGKTSLHQKGGIAVSPPSSVFVSDLSRPQRIIVTGGDTCQNFTVHLDGAVSEKVGAMSSPMDTAPESVDSAGISHRDAETGCTISNIAMETNGLSHKAMKTAAHSRPGAQPYSDVKFEMLTLSNVTAETAQVHSDATMETANVMTTDQVHNDVAIETVQNGCDFTTGTSQPLAAMDTVETDPDTAVESPQCEIGGQQVIGYLPEDVVLDTDGVLGSAGFGQQIIITTTTVDGECVILSADVQHQPPL